MEYKPVQWSNLVVTFSVLRIWFDLCSLPLAGRNNKRIIKIDARRVKDTNRPKVEVNAIQFGRASISSTCQPLYIIVSSTGLDMRDYVIV